MKSCFPLLTLVCIVLFSCAGKKQIITVNASGGDGSSYEQAVIINETHESPGTTDEYAWLNVHYPHYKNQGQALVFNEKTPYDVLSIITRDGKAISVYFNISKFYGKF